MKYDEMKVDEVILALLFLNTLDEQSKETWNGLDWDSLNRLHERGLIATPRKGSRVALTEEAYRLAKVMFEKYFSTSAPKDE